MEVYEVLASVVLGGILGAVGQGIRVIVGIKKHQDEASASGKKWEDWFEMKQLLLSLIIALTIGGIAGVLGAIGLLGTEITKESMITLNHNRICWDGFHRRIYENKNSNQLNSIISALSPNRAYLASAHSVRPNPAFGGTSFMLGTLYEMAISPIPSPS